MIGNIKALGLAVALALAVGAIGAPAAMAIPEFKAETAPVVLTGAQTNAQKFFFNYGGVSCSAGKLEGEMAKQPTTQITLTPTYTSCFYEKMTEVEFTVNGCAYIMTLKTILPLEASAKIECPAGKQMEIDAPGCTIKIGAQEGLVQIPVENLNVGQGKNRDVKLEIKLSMMEYSQKGMLCKSELLTNGAYSGNITLQAEEKGKTELVGLWVE